MPFQTPITVQKALERIHRHEYVLPAIQREFVWQDGQICTLFDTLMQGYPIGSFLFWNVTRERVRDYKYFDFVRDYHQRDNPHCPALAVPPNQGVVAVLDGQQRLTALNIGLRGSLAVKEPHKRWTSAAAFPIKRLYLNLLDVPDDNEPPFAFLTEARAAAQQDSEHAWFPVHQILTMAAGADIFKYVLARGLNTTEQPFEFLSRLHDVVYKDGVIAYYEEDGQELDKVLRIFIRTNQGGTKLSYSDLLLSTAVAQWSKRDARKEIHALVDEVNAIRFGFSLSKDFVLKAGLMLADIKSVGFKVDNFTHDNMVLLEDRWPAIATAIRVTVGLVADFGLSGWTLSADSSLLPIAYYLYRRGFEDSFRTSVKDCDAQDRKQIKAWLVRSLLKAGVWGSGLDTLLTAIRKAIREAPVEEGFPVKAIEAAMAERSKPLRFSAEEVQHLVETAYGDPRTFPLLSLLYPHVDPRNQFHVDHVFPRGHFTEARLTRAGVPASVVGNYKAQVDQLPNLQLLDATENQSKQDELPGAWLKARYPEEQSRLAFMQRNDLGEVGEGVTAFPAFFAARRERLVHRVAKLLGADLSAVANQYAAAEPDAGAPG